MKLAKALLLSTCTTAAIAQDGIYVEWQHSFDGGVEWANRCGADIYDAEILHNGDVVFVGCFSNVGDANARDIARWDGVQWHDMSFNIQETRFFDIEVDIDGTIYITGEDGVYRLGENSWIQLGTLMPQGSPLHISPSGDLYAARESPNSVVYRWDGLAWIQVGPPVAEGGVVHDIDSLDDGTLVVAGVFNSKYAPVEQFSSVQFWTGSEWTDLEKQIYGVVNDVFISSDGNLYAGGELASQPVVLPLNQSLFGLARYGNSGWDRLLPNKRVRAILELEQNGLLLGGSFDLANGGLVVYREGLVMPIKNGVKKLVPSHSTGNVNTLLREDSGHIVVAGSFTGAGCILNDNIASITSLRICPADFNSDGILDNGDIGAFVASYLSGQDAGDFNADCILDNGDIGAFVTAFLAGC